MQYQPQAAAEKSKLAQEEHSFRMEVQEAPQSSFGRFAVIYSHVSSQVQSIATWTLIST